MALTAKILSWRFRHLNIVGCLLKRRPTKGGSRAPQVPPWLRPWNVLLTENLCFNICGENIGKGICCLFAHRGSVALSIEVEQIFFDERINLSIPRR